MYTTGAPPHIAFNWTRLAPWIAFCRANTNLHMDASKLFKHFSDSSQLILQFAGLRPMSMTSAGGEVLEQSTDVSLLGMTKMPFFHSLVNEVGNGEELDDEVDGDDVSDGDE